MWRAWDDVRGTKFGFELGGGLLIPIGAHLQIDGGYRFMRISDINVSLCPGDGPCRPLLFPKSV